MLQKVNTVLLVAILGVLVFVALRPQPSRYYFLQSTTIAFDTATGQLVLVENSPKLQAWYDEQESEEKAEKARKKTEEVATRNRWLENNCPDILSAPVPSLKGKAGSFDRQFSEMQRGSFQDNKQECQEWQQAQRTAAE